jgi:hypothetical protein
MKSRPHHPPIAVVGAGAVGPFGADWRAGLATLDPSAELPLEPLEDAAQAKARKLMSRPARLAALAMKAALRDAGWASDPSSVGCFLGVGASGGSMEELEALLAASAGPEGFSLERFGQQGLAACNPLFAFQLMNNFTLCHGAILNGILGPNAAFFSQGSGTVHALDEACWALAEGTCDRALAGGADSALHPVTRAELRRESRMTPGVPLAEGAAVLALARRAESPLAWVDDVNARPVDLVVRARSCSDELYITLPKCRLIDMTLESGEALAATPALAWVRALLELQAGRAERAMVVTVGPYRAVSQVVLSRSRP